MTMQDFPDTAEQLEAKIESIIKKLANQNAQPTVTLSKGDAATLIAWLQVAGLVQRPN